MTKLADSLAQWTEWTRENILPLKANVWKVWPVDAGRMRQRLYECAARGYERAGYTEKAELVLKQCLGELPESKGISLRLASLYTQPPHADYKAAYEALRQELEVDPDAGEDLRMSIALIFGEIGSGGRELKQAVDQHLNLDRQHGRRRGCKSARPAPIGAGKGPFNGPLDFGL
ncbi:MAG TPA: hypothetical protein VML01_08295 [Bryobacterales bacterium]|nr:hypothetical protein [Bryobacterales bacterium]